ncbi:MAG: hypothetical protein M1839_005478 [Geoglossum umbratile]|nr:MAG: hypothetical protein M1839_005478 [Geoglossum umbratile]
MPQFVYSESLCDKDSTLGRSRIRLLRLLPAQDTHSAHLDLPLLRSELYTIDFKDSSRPLGVAHYVEPRYEALSYAWGDGSTRRKLIISGREFSITTNLEVALRHLQLSDQVRTLWVDAICINQGDIDEKAHQVRIMRKIYQEAHRVIIWLGPEADHSATALMRLEQLGKKCVSIMAQHRITFRELREQTEWGVEVSIAKTQALNRDFETALCSLGYDQKLWLKPVNNLLSRSWWERAWIRQELAVSKDPMVVCGRDMIPWLDFAAGIMLLMIRADYLLLNQVWENRALEGNPIEKFGDLAREHVTTLVQFHEEFQRTASEGMDFKTVLGMLMVNNHAECTDPKDCIFSIVGLANDLGSCGPEWQRPIGYFRILTYNQPIKNLKTLPSWVPDWTQPFTFNIAEHFGKRIYNANCRLNPTERGLGVEQIFLGEGIIRLPVIHFDTIFDLGQSFEEVEQKSQDAIDFVHDWMVNCTNVFRFRGGVHRTTSQSMAHAGLCSQMGIFPYGSLDPLDADPFFEAMAKTIVMDRGVGQTAPPGYYGVSYDRSNINSGSLETRMFNVWFDREQVPEAFLPGSSLSYGRRKGKFCDAFALRAVKNAIGRRPLLSNAGYFGLVPHTARMNDKLVIILGAHVPFVALQVSDRSHELIGACYVHGVMAGEMAQDYPIPIEAFEFQ